MVLFAALGMVIVGPDALARGKNGRSSSSSSSLSSDRRACFLGFRDEDIGKL